MKTKIYIDWSNLENGFRRSKVLVDYLILKKWLSQKYQTEEIYVFVGYIKANSELYSVLERYGFKLEMKETKKIRGKYKGNCDTEITLKIVSDFYKKISIGRFL